MNEARQTPLPDLLDQVPEDIVLGIPGDEPVFPSYTNIPIGKHARQAAAELRRLAAVEAQRDALLEALKEYGWHHEGCPQYPTYTHPDRWPACTCGFDDAIKAAERENT